MTAALASSVKAASEEHGIPERTIGYWMESPEFAELRDKTRGELAAEMKVIAHLAASRLASMLRSGDVEARDVIVALGVAVDKSQLLSGEATHRTESLTGGLNDDERARLRAAIDRLSVDLAAADEGSVAVGAGAEVRQ